MANSLATLRSEVKTILVRTDISDALIDQRLHWALREMCAKIEIENLEVVDSSTVVLTTSQQSYALPTNLDVLRAAKINGEEFPLVETSHGMWAGLDHEETGEPRRFIRFGVSAGAPAIYVHPVPDSGWNGRSLVLWYQRLHPTLSTTQGTLVPDELDEVLVLGAAARVFRDTLELEKASEFMRQFRAGYKAYRDVRGRQAVYGGGSVAPMPRRIY